MSTDIEPRTTLTADELITARVWLVDCWTEALGDLGDACDHVQGMSDRAVTKQVTRTYDGGLAAFIRDAPNL